ncbi:MULTISPECIES: hypothetical protein [Roseobacteraceae]|uniref:hypothetical protein n=1 Tax=Roseobacteraceae TaxID=2854170 RepID=UPI001C47FEEC|nr:MULTISPECIES: hypothetical protein [Roseobacteraceae]MBV7408959.1 hypothetical protein [Maritimibacter sp. DP1N21-5]MBY5934354.1 hypothetical protein [Tateyamaria omphalii]
MPDLRRPAHHITPAYEDNGLFRSPVRRITVGLVPQMHRNNRQDLVVRAFLSDGAAIEVLFAGRRTKQALGVEKRLRSLLFQTRTKTPGWRDEGIDTVQLPVRIEGVWRSRFIRDAWGCETRQYQLIAARWALFDEAGIAHLFGEAPVHLAPPRPARIEGRPRGTV